MVGLKVGVPVVVSVVDQGLSHDQWSGSPHVESHRHGGGCAATNTAVMPIQVAASVAGYRGLLGRAE